MQVSRRFVTMGMAATLGACGGGFRAEAPLAPAEDPTLRPVPNAGYDAWLSGFRGRALSAGIDSSVVDRALGGAGYLPGVIERDRNQTEFTRTLEDYLSIAASEERVATGRQMFRQYGSTLSSIEQRYGVPAEIVTAIWGVESRYGARRGDIPVVSALSTLAYDGRRGQFFEQQLIAALRILQNGDISADRMTGSWAGAMGHTQFIPTSYQAYAVDFTGDGRRDIWSEDPTDALASAAAYLSRSGWRSGQRWVGEAGTAAAPGGGSRLTPQPGGPTFVVGRNFSVIKRYNNSDNYAIGVGHLANRIAGAGPIRGSFPPDRYGLTKEDRVALQQRLTRAGFDTQGTDGVVGPDTRAAISAYQRSAGLSPTGDPSPQLLARLR
ncbi:lytic murein transglycosylase [Tranquillimonas rosea]|uniref:Lytic murein transglycosylase n=1 Tax=Tranquillimonas rosea TaxID=641238 RepID=A0A1H9UAW1_9RHOB|nr:lytic murein transglycosylase [Tranquillimonas rosea]SES06586.1 lytic murein transglycosylase [Tranquillimonas rosea]